MSRFTVVIGILLVVLGIVSYTLTHGASPTALIPVAFGIAYIVLGQVALHKDAARKHVMHVAAMLSLVGILGNVMATITAIHLLAGGHTAHPAAVWSRTLMLLLCAIHLVTAIRSFVVNRLIKPAA